jgi:hypothetical protein
MHLKMADKVLGFTYLIALKNKLDSRTGSGVHDDGTTTRKQESFLKSVAHDLPIVLNLQTHIWPKTEHACEDR